MWRTKPSNVEVTPFTIYLVSLYCLLPTQLLRIFHFKYFHLLFCTALLPIIQRCVPVMFTTLNLSAVIGSAHHG
ncbi:hypothetical protein FKM82_026515 [Ascaphus truei]